MLQVLTQLLPIIKKTAKAHFFSQRGFPYTVSREMRRYAGGDADEEINKYLETKLEVFTTPNIKSIIVSANTVEKFFIDGK